ncbi:MAG: DMT family transporter [Alphaproteobacteria bacterium]|nr:DMT family transporter [Alphaproteobacteria bacterium]
MSQRRLKYRAPLPGQVRGLAMDQSLQETETSFIVPFTFFQLIWASAYGFALFGEVPSSFVWIGATVTVGATSYMAYWENRLGTVDRSKESVGSR